MNSDLTAPILFAVAMLAIAPARAQSRTVALVSPPQLGVHGVFRYDYPATAVSDPLVGGGTVRIVRGGAWNDFSRDCRSAFRAGIGQHFSGINLGFRVVLAPALP